MGWHSAHTLTFARFDMAGVMLNRVLEPLVHDHCQRQRVHNGITGTHIATQMPNAFAPIPFNTKYHFHFYTLCVHRVLVIIFIFFFPQFVRAIWSTYTIYSIIFPQRGSGRDREAVGRGKTNQICWWKYV